MFTQEVHLATVRERLTAWPATRLRRLVLTNQSLRCSPFQAVHEVLFDLEGEDLREVTREKVCRKEKRGRDEEKK